MSSNLNYPQRRRNHDNPGGKTQSRDVNAAVRVQTAIKLKAMGLEWDEVAAQAGYGSKGAAHNAVHRELARCLPSNIEDLRREEGSILKQLHRRCMKAAMDEKNKGFLFAVDRVLAIQERYSKLMGLDTPIDQAVAMNQIIVREVPQGLLSVVEQVS